ncbi:Hsp20/alpha crystallin family protein [Fulvivirga sp. RKSG066]|uniref:Hsp20/alpha crystallin family protein n=1 Tax=Fulvivirga aurantia TaxID=2529383 RepID=UPI0012BCB0A6|nr:Hsp20/alpha crystallin family protein [Fulvivirga aurantia]MTI21772.1 Hsp20/alpha crystallin family protein [Fulvivirga aurantia]
MGLLTPRTGPFHRIGDRYATMFDLDHFLGRNAFEDSWMAMPPRNIRTKGDHIEVEVAMPGFKKKDVNIELKDGFLYISAQRKRHNNGDKKFVEKQVPDKIADQVIELGADVDEASISAKLANGMLTITIPKSAKPQKASKQIMVA